MSRPTLHLKRPLAALLRPAPGAPAPAPVVHEPEPEPPSPGQLRTKALIASIEAHTRLPPEQLALALLLPGHYRPHDERHAVLPTVAIQLWLEGRAGEAAFSEDEEARVLDRACRRYQWSDPVLAPRPRPGGRPPPPPAAAATRAQRWAALAAEMQRSNLPAAVIRRLEPAAPPSRSHLAQLLRHGRLRELHLSREHENVLRGWLRLPLLPDRREHATAKHVRQFAQQVREWEAKVPKEAP